jgi:hypothetical protein
MFRVLVAEAGWGPFRWLAERITEALKVVWDNVEALWSTIWSAVRALGDTLLGAFITAAQGMMPDVAATWSANSGLVAQINHVFPLSETLALASVLFGLWVLVFGYKLVKSWLPTVSS